MHTYRNAAHAQILQPRGCNSNSSSRLPVSLSVPPSPFPISVHNILIVHFHCCPRVWRPSPRRQLLHCDCTADWTDPCYEGE